MANPYWKVPVSIWQGVPVAPAPARIETPDGGVAYRPFGILRTFLACLVIVQHVGHVGPPMDKGNWAPGSIAVLLFFVLSGFVITEAALQFYRRRPQAFAVNRFLRIVPQYAISLLLSIAAIAFALHLDAGFLPNDLVPNTAAEFFNAHNLACNAVAFLPGPCNDAAFFVPYVWALRVECLFYAVAALGIWIGCYDRRAAIAFVCLASAVMYVCALLGKGPSAFAFVPYFVLGIGLYLAATKPTALVYASAAAAFAVSLWTTVAMVMPGFTAGRHITAAEGFFHVAAFSALCGTLIVLALTRVSKPFQNLDRAIGNLSYPIYLQQYCILVLALALLPRSYWTIALVFPAAFVTAWITDWLAERPLRALRDRIRGRNLSEKPSTRHRASAGYRTANVSGNPG